jgi:hypothetical protein
VEERNMLRILSHEGRSITGPYQFYLVLPCLDWELDITPMVGRVREDGRETWEAIPLQEAEDLTTIYLYGAYNSLELTTITDPYLPYQHRADDQE